MVDDGDFRFPYQAMKGFRDGHVEKIVIAVDDEGGRVDLRDGPRPVISFASEPGGDRCAGRAVRFWLGENRPELEICEPRRIECGRVRGVRVHIVDVERGGVELLECVPLFSGETRNC